jgi:hypothetical protein
MCGEKDIEEKTVIKSSKAEDGVEDENNESKEEDNEFNGDRLQRDLLKFFYSTFRELL